jgi:hypothetical protein
MSRRSKTVRYVSGSLLMQLCTNARLLRLKVRFRGRLPGRRRIDLVLAFAEVGQQVLDRLLRVPLQAAQPAQRRVDDDAVQPGAEARQPLEAADPRESGHEGVLHGVAGILLVPEDAPGDDQHSAAAGADARLKGIVVTGLHPRQQGRFIQDRPGPAG